MLWVGCDVRQYSLSGVCHAYIDDAVAFRRKTGFNFPFYMDGVVMYEHVLSLHHQGRVRAVTGQTFSFAELPKAKIQSRASVDRSIIVMP